MPLRLFPEEDGRDAVEEALAVVRRELAELLPEAEVDHIGATSVPGSLTKGDLDVLVSVPAERLRGAAETLSERYSINQPEAWSESFASFDREPVGPVAVGVQLVAAGSGDERVFLAWRELLRRDPELLRRYDELKRAHADEDRDRYIAAKGEFIESHVGGLEDGRSGGGAAATEGRP